MRTIALLLLAAPAAWAQSSGGTKAAEFLRVEQGGRALGMGGAYAAVADDGSSMWWNPAGLARSDFREVTISHARLIEDVHSQYVTLVYPVSQAIGTFGASLTYYDVPGIEAFSAAKGAAGSLTSNGYAASLAYARTLVEGLTAGANLKVIGQRLDDEKSQGVAVDAGVQYRHKQFGAGASVSNMGKPLSVAGNDVDLPLVWRVGVFVNPHKRLTLAVDEEKENDGPFRFHVGSEWRVSNHFSLRAGFEQIPNLGGSAGYTFGLGYFTTLGGPAGWAGDETPWWEKKMDEGDRASRLDGAYVLTFDYAFISFGDLSDTHRFTLGVKF